jgi:hypothetical protein
VREDRKELTWGRMGFIPLLLHFISNSILISEFIFPPNSSL